MTDQNNRWTVVYRNPAGPYTITMVQDAEPTLANVQAVDKSATALMSTAELHRSLYRINYHVRGVSDPKHAYVVAYDQADAAAQLGEVDNVSVINVASDVFVFGLDDPFPNKFPVVKAGSRGAQAVADFNAPNNVPAQAQWHAPTTPVPAPAVGPQPLPSPATK